MNNSYKWFECTQTELDWYVTVVSMPVAFLFIRFYSGMAMYDLAFHFIQRIDCQIKCNHFI